MTGRLEHLACIMDGNRRWAKLHGYPSWYGHKQGLDTAKRVMLFCLEHNISYLSLYTFSLENFKRSESEKKYIFSQIVYIAQNEVSAFIKKDIRIKFIGDREKFPDQLKQVCKQIESDTSQCTKLTVNLLFCYGGQQEIESVMRNIAHDVEFGKLKAEALTQKDIYKYLWTQNTPPPDLIIRTGGVQRLSNFLLFQAAYSEIRFLDCMWPELSDTHLMDIISSFGETERRYGT